MARLFPKIKPSEIKNSGERKVAQALVKHLPKRVEVFHSFNYLKTNESGVLLEGECDFVVLDSKDGILFVEVKGGSLEFNPERMEWLRVLPSGKHQPINKDPFAQARGSMHIIINLIKRRFGHSKAILPFTYGYAVAFPDCSYKGVPPPSVVRDLILDAQKLEEPKNATRRIFDHFHKPTHRALSARELETTREALFPKFSLIPVLWRTVEDQEERLQRLTDDQGRLLKFLDGRSKAAIRGVAGSGKTMLALAKAQWAARHGMRTLVVCYNRPLKNWLKQKMPESFGDNLVIDTYHGLVDKLCRQANIASWKPEPDDDNFWITIAPECLLQACEKLGPEQKFDAVVVDEGQDFHDLWWTSLDSLFRDSANKGCYYVFFDPNQNLYVKSPSSPPSELGTPYPLDENCRNTVLIGEHCASLVGQKTEFHDDAPNGEQPRHLQVGTLSEGFNEAGKIVRQWCQPAAGGLKLSQVAVLARRQTEQEWPDHFQTIPTTRDFDRWRDNKGVLIATWRQFKGLEADAVVILETAMTNDADDKVHRYVAHSRAKHLLAVIEVESI